MSVLSVIIPAYNEGRTIHHILDRVRTVKLLNNVAKEIIIVNDCSTDDTEEAIIRYREQFPDFGIRYLKHEVNQGKGAAIHTGIREASGDYIIIQDADLEYDPEEYNLLLKPVLKGTADVVYGSRFIGGKPHRILFFWHTIGNKFLTFVSNMFSNLNLTDMETCYKLFKSDMLKAIPLVENRFGFEPEVTQKISRIPGIRIYEVGISYYGRTYDEGKKIGWKDGFRALYCILKYGLSQDSSRFVKIKDTAQIHLSKKAGLWLAILLGAFFFINGTQGLKKHYHSSGYSHIFVSDGLGYYQYLPAQFNVKNLKHGQKWYLILDDGTPFNKFTWGVAYMQAPFYFTAELWQSLTDQKSDGYTATNGFFILLGAMIYCFLALLLIFKMLQPRFGMLLSLATVVLLFYATNLIFYTLVEPATSHVYSFFLVTLFVYRTPFFYRKPSVANLLWLAIPLAIIILIRQTSGIIALYLLLYDIKNWKLFSLRIVFWFRKWHLVLLMAVVVFIVFIPQFVYWHLITGKYYVYAYGYNKMVNETFLFWKNPQFGEVLAGPVSGWIMYTPVMIFALVGMVWMLVKKEATSWGTLLVFAVVLYVISSWWCYTFDCGFGHRAFIDFYGLLALPFAFTFQKIFLQRRFVFKLLIVPALVFMMYLNIRLSMMYRWDPCWNGPSWTWKHYGNVIHRASVGGDYKQNYHQLND